ILRSKSQEDLSQSAKSDVSHWYRLEVLPGLEIQISDDFIYPASPQEQANLLQLMAQQLVYLLSKRTQP
ncbi:MAG: MerR family transcriptional regulator, partial [Cyanobacteria bacterium J06659_2]